MKNFVRGPPLHQRVNMVNRGTRSEKALSNDAQIVDIIERCFPVLSYHWPFTFSPEECHNTEI